MDTVPFFSSYVDPSAKTLVSQTVDSTFLSEGKKVQAFEDILKKEHALSHPIAVNSGTSALHLGLLLADVKPGDEVIVPAQTFVASALAVLYVGAKPVFVDINYEDGNIQIESLRKKITKKTVAVMPVHWAGYPCDMKGLRDIAREHKLHIIEDAAHAFGAKYKGKAIGSISPITCFSFQAIKHVTTGDGGAVACLKRSDMERAKRLRWFGIDRARSKPSLLGERQFQLNEVGYKYHMNDVAASIGIANLKTFKKRLKRRKAVAARYTKELSNISGLQLFAQEADRESSWWLFGMHVEKRLRFIKALQSKKIAASVVHQRIDRYNIFGGLTPGLLNQEKFDKTQIHIPMHDALTDEQVSHIIETIKKGW